MPRTTARRYTLVGVLALSAVAATACRSAPSITRAGETAAAPRTDAGTDAEVATAALVAQLFRPCRQCSDEPAVAALRARRFGALEHAHVLATYLPDRDRAGQAIDVEPWETEALTLQGHLFGGATSWPSRGSYRESDADGRVGAERIILEHTRMVISFASQRDFSPAALAAVAGFLDRFRRETGQDSVALVIDGEMYLR